MKRWTTLGGYVRGARENLGMSLRALAARLELSPAYLSDIENDRRVPAEETMARLAAALLLDTDELMARGGKLGEQAEAYIRSHPTAILILRKMAARNMGEADIERLLSIVEAL